jgi:hypothetical protein
VAARDIVYDCKGRASAAAEYGPASQDVLLSGNSDMDYYERVVIDYLRADRAVFVNTEFCIQVNPAKNPDTSGPHWYCDVVVLDFRSQTIFLCEISYAANLSGLVKRLKGWHEHWDKVRKAVWRDGLL